MKGMKQGKWVNTVPEIRGEPGYEEEGYYKDDKKTGTWRKYNENGDLIAIENYKFGGKHGTQDYFSFLGAIERHEEWKGYNPDAPYDTIPVYGEGNNEIIEYKLVKAEQYSVPHGEWKYFNPTGHVIKTERYDRGQLIKDAPPPVAENKPAQPKEKVKTKEILEYEKKYSKKKRNQMERVGKTAL
jgi:antitoxin component YwqK of YwqJK toxin-antitoxin module